MSDTPNLTPHIIVYVLYIDGDAESFRCPNDWIAPDNKGIGRLWFSQNFNDEQNRLEFDDLKGDFRVIRMTEVRKVWVRFVSVPVQDVIE